MLKMPIKFCATFGPNSDVLVGEVGGVKVGGLFRLGSILPDAVSIVRVWRIGQGTLLEEAVVVGVPGFILASNLRGPDMGKDMVHMQKRGVFRRKSGCWFGRVFKERGREWFVEIY